MSTADVALLVSIAAAIFAGLSALAAWGLKRQAKRSADASERSARAAERSLQLEEQDRAQQVGVIDLRLRAGGGNRRQWDLHTELVNSGRETVHLARERVYVGDSLFRDNPLAPAAYTLTPDASQPLPDVRLDLDATSDVTVEVEDRDGRRWQSSAEDFAEARQEAIDRRRS